MGRRRGCSFTSTSPNLTISPMRKSVGPTTPYKPPHLSRLSFPQKSQSGLVYDAFYQVSTAYINASLAKEKGVKEELEGGHQRSSVEIQEERKELLKGWDIGTPGRNAWALFDFEGQNDNELQVLSKLFSPSDL